MSSWLLASERSESDHSEPSDTEETSLTPEVKTPEVKTPEVKTNRPLSPLTKLAKPVYVKMLHSNLKHHGHIYKTGLNTDSIEFNTVMQQVAGGLHYCLLENVGSWVTKDFTHVAVVHVPSGARTCTYSSSFKSSSLVLGEIYPIWYLAKLSNSVAKILAQTGIPVSPGYKSATNLKHWFMHVSNHNVLVNDKFSVDALDDFNLMLRLDPDAWKDVINYNHALFDTYTEKTPEMVVTMAEMLESSTKLITFEPSNESSELFKLESSEPEYITKPTAEPTAYEIKLPEPEPESNEPTAYEIKLPEIKLPKSTELPTTLTITNKWRIERLLLRNPHILYDVSNPSEQLHWALIDRNPNNIKYIRNPTSSMVAHVLRISPFFHCNISFKSMSRSDLLVILPFLSPELIKHCVLRHHPDSTDICNAAIKKHTDNNTLLEQYQPAMVDLVLQIPFLRDIFNQCRTYPTMIYGSFVRWLIETSTMNNAVPDLAAVYEFMRGSDIDVVVRYNNFNHEKFVKLIHRLGGHIEFSGNTGYDHREKYSNKPVTDIRNRPGHYHVWIPHNTSWLKFDVTIGNNHIGDVQDFTANTSTLTARDLKSPFYDDIINRKIRPATVSLMTGRHDPTAAKHLLRMGKMFNHGYKLRASQRLVIKHMFRQAECDGFGHVHYTSNNMPVPSMLATDSTVVRVTKYEMTLVTKDRFNADPTIIKLRRWLEFGWSDSLT